MSDDDAKRLAFRILWETAFIAAVLAGAAVVALVMRGAWANGIPHWMTNVPAAIVLGCWTYFVGMRIRRHV